MYIDKKDLYYEIIVSKALGYLTRDATRMLILIVDNCIKKFRYFNEDDRDDCYQGAMCDMLSNWHNFNQEKGTNTFAYFTECFKRGAAQAFNTLYKKKGDNDNKIKVFSLESSNDGNGLHSF